MFLLSVDGSTDLNSAYCNGNGVWALHTERDANVDTHASRCADFSWEPSGSKGLEVWGTTTGEIAYRTYTYPNTWGTWTNVSMAGGLHPWVQLRRNPRDIAGDVKILGIILTGTIFDIGAIKWDGSSFTVIGTNTISSDTTVTTYECFEMEFQNLGPLTADDYELDMEYQFNSTKHNSDNKKVCLYLTTSPTETLIVSYWTGSIWTSLGNIVSTGWTNLTATGLTSTTYNIQIKDQNQSNEGTQHSWSIDCIFLHTWNNTNYLIDFEYNWSNADLIGRTGKVCIYVTSHTGSENLNVNYWSGSWTNLGQITSTGWTNLTATGLSDATYVIQLKGASESGDTSQDSWHIDVMMLHTWPIPTVTTNTSTGVEETNATLWGYLLSGETCTVRFQYGTTTSYGTNTSNQTKTNGQTFSASISSLTKGQLYHYRAYANNTGASDTGDDLKLLTKPDAPSGLTTQANSSTVIYLTWTKGTGANRTYIERSASSVWTRGAGTEVYNNTGTRYENTGCQENTTYYYQAWSYTTWTSNPTIHQWSDTNASANERTNALPTITNPGPANESTRIGLTPLMNITVHDFNDGSLTVRWYSNRSGSWVLFGMNSSVGNGTYRWTNSNFSGYATTYWWNVSVSDMQEVKKSNVFHFTTIEANVSFNITPSAWDQGTILIGSSNATSGLYFNLTNQGVVPINIQIKATNATNTTTGAKWNLRGSPGLDNFQLQYKKSGDESWTTINLTYDTFMLNLPATGIDWQTFDLNLIMATTSSSGDPLSFTITFKSVAA